MSSDDACDVRSDVTGVSGVHVTDAPGGPALSSTVLEEIAGLAETNHAYSDDSDDSDGFERSVEPAESAVVQSYYRCC